MEQLITFLSQIPTPGERPFTAECKDWLRTVIQTRSLKKKEILLRPGQICRNLYFIESGLLKCYYINDKGQTVIDWFFGEKEAIVSIDSFYQQIPGEDYMEAIEDSVLHYISYEQLQIGYARFAEFLALGLLFTNKYLRVWHQQVRNIRMMTTEERYLFFLRTQPEFNDRIEVQDLASYLDMNRETLSRIRSRLGM
jgi:CRP-like cAMP-binding protein